MKYSDESDQFAHKNRNVAFVSRIQCVIAAIESKVCPIKNEYPTDRSEL